MLQDKISTVEEIIDSLNKSKNTDEWIEGYIFEDSDVLKEKFIEFAKFHVEAALEAAYSNSSLKEGGIDIGDKYEDGIVSITVYKDSIKNAYPLDLIK